MLGGPEGAVVEPPPCGVPLPLAASAPSAPRSNKSRVRNLEMEGPVRDDYLEPGETCPTSPPFLSVSDISQVGQARNSWCHDPEPCVRMSFPQDHDP